MDLIETFAGTIWIGAITMAYVTSILHKAKNGGDILIQVIMLVR